LEGWSSTIELHPHRGIIKPENGEGVQEKIRKKSLRFPKMDGLHPARFAPYIFVIIGIFRIKRRHGERRRRVAIQQTLFFWIATRLTPQPNTAP
jgi:hypothetical protein